MTPADDVRQLPWLRYAVLAVALTAMWLVISLFSSAPSASADEQDPGGGLLGTAGSLLGTVTTVTEGAGETLGDVVGTVVEPVNQRLAPVVDAAPASVVDEVPIIVDAATDAANGTVSDANIAGATVLNGLTGALSGVAGGGTLGAVAAPVVGLLDDVVGAVPIVGDHVGGDTLSGVVTPVTGLVDDTLGAVVGSAGELPTDGTGVLPELPGIPLLPGDSESPAEPPTPGSPGSPGEPGEPGVIAPASPGTAASGATAPAMPPHSSSAVAGFIGTSGSGSGLNDALAQGGSLPPPGADLPTSPSSPATPASPSGGGAASGASGAGAGATSGTSDAAFAALELDALASLVLHAVDDALPSSPVYDTDSTPD